MGTAAHNTSSFGVMHEDYRSVPSPDIHIEKNDCTDEYSTTQYSHADEVHGELRVAPHNGHKHHGAVLVRHLGQELLQADPRYGAGVPLHPIPSSW